MGQEGLKRGLSVRTTMERIPTGPHIPPAVRALHFWQELDQTWPISASHG